jgi:hypothetical protein
MQRTSVALTVSTSDLRGIRDWFREYGTRKQARLKAADLLAEYVFCQLRSNADWDGQAIGIDFAATVAASDEPQRKQGK